MKKKGADTSNESQKGSIHSDDAVCKRLKNTDTLFASNIRALLRPEFHHSMSCLNEDLMPLSHSFPAFVLGRHTSLPGGLGLILRKIRDIFGVFFFL